MLLYLVRHGTAISRTDPKCPPDADRHLTGKGITKTRAAMRGLRALGCKPDAMLTSPYLRAVQTAELASEVLRFPAEKIRRTQSLLPGTSPSELFRELAKLRGEEILCFGHVPHLDLALAHALGGRSSVTAMKKAGVACVELDSVSPPKGTLLWLLTGKGLRLLGT